MIFSGKFFVSQCPNYSCEYPSVYQNISGIEKNIHKRGISQNFVEIFLSHNDENLHTGTLQCFRKFRVSKKFVQKNGILRAGDARILKMGRFAYC